MWLAEIAKEFEFRAGPFDSSDPFHRKTSSLA